MFTDIERHKKDDERRQNIFMIGILRQITQIVSQKQKKPLRRLECEKGEAWALCGMER